MVSSVLQTRLVVESHTAAHLSEILTASFVEWGLTDKHITGNTDNAKNIINAWKLMDETTIRCIGHTLNLAARKTLEINSVSQVVGRVKRLVSHFHYSTQSSNLLTAKQALLKLPKRKLIQDVDTRWNWHYQEDPNDTKFVADVKKAICKDLRSRYQEADVNQFLLIASVCHPRFRGISFIAPERKCQIYNEFKNEMCRLSDGLQPDSTIPSLIDIKKEIIKKENTGDEFQVINESDLVSNLPCLSIIAKMSHLGRRKGQCLTLGTLLVLELKTQRTKLW